MRLPFLTTICVLAFAGAAHALPGPPNRPGPVATDATPVAMGCGAGRTRDAMGRCHHPFNRFDQMHRFKAYKQTHCRPMRTPNGTVGFCKVSE